MYVDPPPLFMMRQIDLFIRALWCCPGRGIVCMSAWVGKLGVRSLINRIGDSRTRLPMATKCRCTKARRCGGVEIATGNQNQGGMDEEDSPW